MRGSKGPLYTNHQKEERSLEALTLIQKKEILSLGQQLWGEEAQQGIESLCAEMNLNLDGISEIQANLLIQRLKTIVE